MNIPAYNHARVIGFDNQEWEKPLVFLSIWLTFNCCWHRMVN